MSMKEYSVVVVSQYLVGAKCVYAFTDGVLLVSPAIYDLMSHADPEEMERLLSQIPCKSLPFPSVYRPDEPFLDRVFSEMGW